MEKYDFIKLMLKSRNLSVNDKKRLVLLATREIEKKESVNQGDGINVSKGEKNSKKEQVHAPKDTAAFLSLFNREDGFKFLTHDFDPDSEMEYDELIKSVISTFNSAAQEYTIPASLYAFMKNVLFGGKEWIDCNGTKHKEHYSCKEWIQWAKENPKIHILSNESINKIIMAFRSTIRLVESSRTIDSRIETIIKRQKKVDLSISTVHLEEADFYTYVFFLEKGIGLILSDMSKYSADCKNVQISLNTSLDGDYKLWTFKITQYGSFSSKSLQDVQNKCNEGGGDFFTIRKYFRGYCNWSVESKWAGKGLRWNILDDTGKEETEELYSDNIPGFTHILTYYSKIKQ